MAYEAEPLRRVGTREVRFGLYELTAEANQEIQAADDPVDIVTEMLRGAGQQVNSVVLAAADAPSTPIYFPEGPAPIVAHVEFPEEVASMWVVLYPGGGGDDADPE